MPTHRSSTRQSATTRMPLFALVLAALAQACAPMDATRADMSWRTSTTLDVVFDQPDPEIRRVERDIHLYHPPLSRDSYPYLLIKTELRTSFRWGDIGEEGRVLATAHEYSDGGRIRKKKYAIDVKGLGVALEDHRIVVTDSVWQGKDTYRYYNPDNGKLVLESLGRAAELRIPDRPRAWNGYAYHMLTSLYGAYSPIDPNAANAPAEKDRIAGILTYINWRGRAVEALLMADDPEVARGLAQVVDQYQTLTWINRKTGEQQNPFIAREYEDIAAVALRLRFYEDHLDLFFPVTRDDFDYARLQLPKGLSLVPFKKKN